MKERGHIFIRGGGEQDRESADRIVERKRHDRAELAARIEVLKHSELLKYIARARECVFEQLKALSIDFDTAELTDEYIHFVPDDIFVERFGDYAGVTDMGHVFIRLSNDAGEVFYSLVHEMFHVYAYNQYKRIRDGDIARTRSGYEFLSKDGKVELVWINEAAVDACARDALFADVDDIEFDLHIEIDRDLVNQSRMYITAMRGLFQELVHHDKTTTEEGLWRDFKRGHFTGDVSVLRRMFKGVEREKRERFMKLGDFIDRKFFDALEKYASEES